MKTTNAKESNDQQNETKAKVKKRQEYVTERMNLFYTSSNKMCTVQLHLLAAIMTKNYNHVALLKL